MIKRINNRCLTKVLEDHKFFPVSFDTFQERVQTHRLRIARDFFLENEDYHLLIAMRDQREFFQDKCIFINVFQGKKVFITRSEFYSEMEYKAIFKNTGVKLSKDALNSLIKIANGY